MQVPSTIRGAFAPPVRLTVAFALIALAAASGPVAAREGASTAVFDEAARIVRNNFYDRKMHGVDWDAAVARHKAGYAKAGTDTERSAAINGLLGELDASHMIHTTREDPRYYELVDIFRYGLRREIRKHFPNGISYPGIGIATRGIEGKTFVSAVFAGFPADEAGITVGDEIVSIDEAPFEAVGPFEGKVGSTVKVGLRREQGGDVATVDVRPQRIEPGEAFRKAMRESARVIEADGKRIGYIRVLSYAGERYQHILMEELASGTLKDADALIWDLRDGWGGAQPRYLDLFNARGPDMTLTERSGETSYGNFKWRKPVAMLVNGGTRSGKEVLAFGFKSYGYGEVIGSRTAGALLAGRGYLLSDGSFLMVAVNDVAVDGERLEGKGVVPTITVEHDIRYSKGADPQLDKAIEVLSQSEGG